MVRQNHYSRGDCSQQNIIVSNWLKNKFKSLLEIYGLIEVKLGGETLINEGVETLTSLAKQIDTTRMKAPAFKMILTATGEHAYRRPEDGIYIVPIGCLKQ